MELLKTNYENLNTEQLLNYTKDMDAEARNILVMRHTKLVHFTIQCYNYRRYNREYEDIYQDGVVGLIEGIQKYSESDRRYALSTFVILHIRNSINGNAESYYSICGPINAVRQQRTVQKVKSKLKRKITPKELEMETGISAKRQADIHRLEIKTIPFSDPSYDYIGESLHRRSHLSKYASDLIHHQRRIEEKIESKIVVDKALRTKRLNAREKTTLRLIYGFDDDNPLTLEGTGKKLNVTRERVRQIEAKALRRLRHPSISKGLRQDVSTPLKLTKNRPKIKITFNHRKQTEYKNNTHSNCEMENLNIMFHGYNPYEHKYNNEAQVHPGYQQLIKDLSEYIAIKLTDTPYKISGYIYEMSNINNAWLTSLECAMTQQPKRVVIPKEQSIELKDIDVLLMVTNPNIMITRDIIDCAKELDVKTIIVSPDRYFK